MTCAYTRGARTVRAQPRRWGPDMDAARSTDDAQRQLGGLDFRGVGEGLPVVEASAPDACEPCEPVRRLVSH